MVIAPGCFSSLTSLLAKELIELAAVRRTYVLRALYALGLFTVFVAAFRPQLAALSAGDRSVLGQGAVLFDTMMAWQFLGAYLFLPLLVAPLVATDDERGTLDLLLVSGISPLSYLVQKLASRLVGMGSFLLLALPLGGVAFALGGIDEARIATAAICLGFACLQVGAWALWCSAKSHTAMRAMATAYLWGPLWLFIVAPAVVMAPLALLASLGKALLAEDAGWLQGAYILPFTLYHAAARSDCSPAHTVVAGLPMAASALGFVLLAWRALLRRSTTMSPQMREQMRVYRPGLAYEQRRRRRLMTSGGDQATLPDDRPIAWREIRRVRWFRREYRGRWQVGLPALIGMSLLLCYIDLRLDARGDGRAALVGGLHHLAYLMAIPAIAIQAAGLISGERMRNSLDILLVSPLGSAELIRQKLAGCDRLGWALLGLIAWLAALEWFVALHGPAPLWGCLRLLAAVSTAWIYLRLAAWVAMAVSLRLRAQVQATVVTMALLVAWVVLPPLAIGVATDLAHADPEARPWPLLGLLSPAAAVLDAGRDPAAWAGRMATNLVLYSGALWLVRNRCLRGADALLGRAGRCA
jgi:ABC-type transport system involved in multi-copper enzyme maturation permease subunit